MPGSIGNKTNHSRDDWEEVLEGCRKNKREAQERLYRHFFPIMEKMVLRHTRDEDKIISILNDGFLKVFLKIDMYKSEGSLEGWIRKIMYHSISDYFRKYKSDLKFLIYDSTDRVPTVNAQHDLYYQDLLSLLDQLPEMHMKVFHLNAIEGFAHKEISEQLNINTNTCRWYLSEARKLLQAAYQKKFLKNYNEAG